VRDSELDCCGLIVRKSELSYPWFVSAPSPLCYWLELPRKLFQRAWNFMASLTERHTKAGFRPKGARARWWAARWCWLPSAWIWPIEAIAVSDGVSTYACRLTDKFCGSFFGWVLSWKRPLLSETLPCARQHNPLSMRDLVCLGVLLGYIYIYGRMDILVDLELNLDCNRCTIQS
jgi:hypothetical protein